MKTALCTISAHNYMPYGLDCLYSVKNFNPNYDVYYLIADKFDGQLYSKFHNDIKFVSLEALDIATKELEELEFKYNVVEFNTSVKPLFYLYLFSLGYDNVIYFDPDFECYASLKPLEEMLINHSFVVVPHKITCRKSSFLTERDFINNGIYNLGFIGMHNTASTKEFLKWWDENLRKSCYLDYKYGMATDQIWLNLGTIYFDGAYVSKHPGMDTAFWNLDERKIEYKDGKIKVNDTDLLFFHFSSLSLNCKKEFLKKIIDICPDFERMYEEHKERVLSYDFEKFSSIRYAFNYYDNGMAIDKNFRRFCGYAGLLKNFDGLFKTNKGSLYWKYVHNKLSVKDKSNLNPKYRIVLKLIKIFGIKKVIKWSSIVASLDLGKVAAAYNDNELDI